MGKPYVKLQKGDILEISNGGTLNLACCDCGLVHTVDVTVKDKKARLVLTRDNRRTGQYRRYNFN